MSGVRCQYFFNLFFLEKEVKLVGGGSVINGATPSSFHLGTIHPVTPVCCIVFADQGFMDVSGFEGKVCHISSPQNHQMSGL